MNIYNYTRDHTLIYREHLLARILVQTHSHTSRTQSQLHMETTKSYTLLLCTKPETVTSERLYCPAELHLNFIPFQFQLEPLRTINNPFQACEA